MKLMFYGANREVTGSCHGVEVGGKKLLVDCGMYQGHDATFGASFAFAPGEIDCVVVTHAHIDHSGRLPLLVKQGFSGKIYATGPTCELLDIMLRDSAHIQEFEAMWKNRKTKRAGGERAEPLYTVADAARVLTMLVPCEYGETVTPLPGVRFHFTDAGHLLGSAFVEMWLSEGAVTKKLAFSGDIGSHGHPMIEDPQPVTEADIVVMESTYGDREHEPSVDMERRLAAIIDRTIAKGGNVICPAFAVGRTQELLYFIREIKEKGLVKSNPNFPVYLDSPLATAATRIYSGNLEGYMDGEMRELIRSGVHPLQFENLHIVETPERSKELNDDWTPKVIISSSGMCEAGRVRHHLKHNIWRRECAVVITGFQAKGTLGRILVDKHARAVTLFGEEVVIACEVHSLLGMSAHADKNGLMDWINAFKEKPERVFVVHGEAEASGYFVQRLIEEGHNAEAPKYTAIYDIITGEKVFEGREVARRGEADQVYRESPVYQRLLMSGTRLIEVITRNKGGANKELAKFADQIDALAKKWDR